MSTQPLLCPKCGHVATIARNGAEWAARCNVCSWTDGGALAVHANTTARAFVYQADVTSIHDGDTIDVTLTLAPGGDLGFQITAAPLTMGVSLRFLGFDAPELATPNGKTARAALVDIMGAHPGPYLVASAHWDKYAGRIDGTITAADGTDIIGEMVKAGWLLPYNGTGSKPWLPNGEKR